MISHLNIKLRFIISRLICRLLGFTGLVLGCLVKSPRSKSDASRSLTAVSHSHLSDLTVHQQAGSHNRQQSKREVTYQNILSEQRLGVISFTPLLLLSPYLPSSFLFCLFCSSLLWHNGSKEMWLCKLMRQTNAFIFILNELGTEFSMWAIWFELYQRLQGGPIFGIKELLYTTIQKFVFSK